MDDVKGKRIGVFRGGVSGEREISLESGEAVLKALTDRGYDVVDCVIDKRDAEYIKKVVDDNSLDIVFIALHGEFGEDGQIQRILEESGIKYTASGPEASENAMDKLKTHMILGQKGIKMPELFSVPCLPCVVKDRYGGSSIGVDIIKNPQDLETLLLNESVIIEEYIQGREFTVGIIDGEPLPVVEIKAFSGFYDYKSKYEDDSTGFIVPAQLAESITVQLQNIAVDVYRALKCGGAARVDIILDQESRPYVLELNSVPGMTSHSLLPLAASKKGLSFNDLCEKIVKLSYI